MRVLLLADGEVGAKILTFLINNYAEDLALIVTTQVNEIYRIAQENDIPVALFDENEILSKLNSGIDLGILAWWPKIIKSPLLDLPILGFINTHPSLLPYNRGKHYNFWALVEQAPFGVTLHFVDSGVDTGPIVAQREIHYDWCDVTV